MFRSINNVTRAKHVARRVATDVWSCIYAASIGEDPMAWSLDRYSYAMYNHVVRTIRENSQMLRMSARLLVSRNAGILIDHAPPPMFASALGEIFSDGVINWGRIIVVYAFTMCAAQEACSRGWTGIGEAIVEKMINYVQEHLCRWISLRGGWVGYQHSLIIHTDFTQDTLVSPRQSNGAFTCIGCVLAFQAMLLLSALLLTRIMRD